MLRAYNESCDPGGSSIQGGTYILNVFSQLALQQTWVSVAVKRCVAVDEQRDRPSPAEVWCKIGPIDKECQEEKRATPRPPDAIFFEEDFNR